MKTLPQIELSFDGQPASGELIACVSEFAIEQAVWEPTSASLVLREPPQGLVDLEQLRVGTAFSMSCDGQAVFSGEVDGVSHRQTADLESIWKLEASDALSKLARSSQVRVFVEVSPVELIEEVANVAGLNVEASVSRPVRQRIVQAGETDLAFLRRVAEEAGLYFVCSEGTLQVYDENGYDSELSFEIGRELIEFEVSESQREQVSRVRVFGWNVEDNSVHPAEVENSADIANAEELSWVESTADDEDARQRGNAELRRRILGRRSIAATAEGDPQVRVGRLLQVDGLASRFAGAFLLSKVTHRLQAESAFVTEFSSKPPLRQRELPRPTAAIGRVARLDDPDGQGRVQVALPAFAEVEMGWLRVLTLGAGPNKGLVILPDVDEDVLVLFPNGDPSSGIVLGGVYGSGEHPDWGIEDKAVRRFALTSRGGQSVRLSDGEHAVRLQNDVGSFLEIGEDKMVIEVMGDLELNAPGRSITIRGSKVDFVQG